MQISIAREGYYKLDSRRLAALRMAAVPATSQNNSANLVDLELGSVELDRFPEDELEVKGDLKSWGTSDLDVLMNLVRIRGLNDADILKVRAFASKQPTNHCTDFFFFFLGVG